MVPVYTTGIAAVENVASAPALIAPPMVLAAIAMVWGVFMVWSWEGARNGRHALRSKMMIIRGGTTMGRRSLRRSLRIFSGPAYQRRSTVGRPRSIDRPDPYHRQTYKNAARPPSKSIQSSTKRIQYPTQCSSKLSTKPSMSSRDADGLCLNTYDLTTLVQCVRIECGSSSRSPQEVSQHTHA